MAETTYAIAKRTAKLQNSSCGLDRNIHGKFTLGFYADKDKCRYGVYHQLVRSTPEQIRDLAKRLGFSRVLDRLPV